MFVTSQLVSLPPVGFLTMSCSYALFVSSCGFIGAEKPQCESGSLRIFISIYLKLPKQFDSRKCNVINIQRTQTQQSKRKLANGQTTEGVDKLYFLALCLFHEKPEKPFKHEILTQPCLKKQQHHVQCKINNKMISNGRFNVENAPKVKERLINKQISSQS